MYTDPKWQFLEMSLLKETYIHELRPIFSDHFQPFGPSYVLAKPTITIWTSSHGYHGNFKVQIRNIFQQSKER